MGSQSEAAGSYRARDIIQNVWLQLEVAADPLADGDEVPAPRLRGAEPLRDWGATQRQEGPREVCQGVQTAEEGPGQGEGGPVAEHRGAVPPPPQGQLLQGGLLQACGGQQDKKSWWNIQSQHHWQDWILYASLGRLSRTKKRIS